MSNARSMNDRGHISKHKHLYELLYTASVKNINIMLKVVLGLLLIHAGFFANLPQYKNKAIALRLVFYPIAALLTYIVVRVLMRRKFRKTPYPYVIDLCLTFVVTFDLLGNT